MIGGVRDEGERGVRSVLRTQSFQEPLAIFGICDEVWDCELDT